MKKILAILLAVFMLAGCESVMNNPTKRVENFLSKYQTLDSEVLNQLEETLNRETSLTKEQKDSYRELIKKQYKSLTYTIKDEITDGNKSTVQVEIEVYDYTKTILDAQNYLLNHPEEFVSENNDSIDNEKFMNYQIQQMNSSNDKIKYTLEIGLTKNNGKWILDDIDEATRQKIHGIYNYTSN